MIKFNSLLSKLSDVNYQLSAPNHLVASFLRNLYAANFLTKYLLFFCCFIACDDNETTTAALECSEVSMQSGDNTVLIANEGAFNAGNATVSYYNSETHQSLNGLFECKNLRVLGDVLHSMTAYNDQLFLVVNNSGKIEVVHKNNLTAIATIDGLSSPRYLLPINENKAYVTDLFANALSIIDLSTYTKIGHIPVVGATEEMVLYDGKVFVSNNNVNFNPRNLIYIIDSATDVLIDSIEVGSSPSAIKQDKNNDLWVKCTDGLYKINPETYAATQVVTFEETNFTSRLAINTDKDHLYYINNDVFAFDVDNLTESSMFSANGRNLYGLGIDPNNGDIYVSDPIDYAQQGLIYRYTSEGIVQDSISAGVIPGSFYFY